ncbi:hypothetical protein REH65_24980 [Saccharopolyspora sp. ID03-671]|uniref:hypothetical protein n=1 Tax=Saccharopolyspora sp. ID03-671 TaxID=3073066 RepID=UPI003251B017
MASELVARDNCEAKLADRTDVRIRTFQTRLVHDDAAEGASITSVIVMMDSERMHQRVRRAGFAGIRAETGEDDRRGH